MDKLGQKLATDVNLTDFHSGATREFIKVDVVGKNSNVGLITLNRPKALNALCVGLMNEVRANLVIFIRHDLGCGSNY